MRNNLILRLKTRYKRWRHGRGFGVHSPFAYDFIVETLRQELPYYAYDVIDAMAAGRDGDIGRLDARRLRQVFRIAARFNPSRVAITGSRGSDALRFAIACAVPRADLDAAASSADMVVVCGADPGSVRPDAVCVFPDIAGSDDEVCERLWRGVSRGMRFDNARGMTVIVASEHLPRQRFDVRF